jgi:hypothetical protein
VPVTVKVVEGTTPDGPLIDAVGVLSVVLKVSNLLTSLLWSLLPLTANALA